VLLVLVRRCGGAVVRRCGGAAVRVVRGRRVPGSGPEREKGRRGCPGGLV